MYDCAVGRLIAASHIRLLLGPVPWAKRKESTRPNALLPGFDPLDTHRIISLKNTLVAGAEMWRALILGTSTGV